MFTYVLLISYSGQARVHTIKALDIAQAMDQVRNCTIEPVCLQNVISKVAL